MRFLSVSLSLIISLFVLAGCKEEKTVAKQPPPPLPIEYIVAKKEKAPVWIEYTSKTEATKRIVVQARVSGRLEEVHFNEGDIVETGQQLFTIEKTTYKAALAQAKATRRKNQATLNLAIADVKRYKPLVADGLAPRATLEQYQARQAELEAVIQSDQAAINDAELNLSYTDVLASTTGRISRRLVDVGNIVGYGENTDLTTIISDNPIYTYFNPTEAEFQIMRKYRAQDKMSARVRVPSSLSEVINRPHFTGHVDFTDNRVDPTTGTISMRAIIENPEHNLLEGTFVYTEIFLTDNHAFFALPSGVTFDDQQGSYVYIVDQENKVKRQNIKRGYSNRHFISVDSGLEEGMKIIVSGLVKLREGISVTGTDASETKSVLAQMKEKGLVNKDGKHPASENDEKTNDN